MFEYVHNLTISTGGLPPKNVNVVVDDQREALAKNSVLNNFKPASNLLFKRSDKSFTLICVSYSTNTPAYLRFVLIHHTDEERCKLCTGALSGKQKETNPSRTVRTRLQ